MRTVADCNYSLSYIASRVANSTCVNRAAHAFVVIVCYFTPVMTSNYDERELLWKGGMAYFNDSDDVKVSNRNHLITICFCQYSFMTVTVTFSSQRDPSFRCKSVRGWRLPENIMISRANVFPSCCFGTSYHQLSFSENICRSPGWLVRPCQRRFGGGRLRIFNMW